MTDVVIPSDLWDAHIEGAITTWYVDNGDVVAEGDLLTEIMVEKVQYEVEAPAAGVIALRAAENDVVKAGDIIATISAADSAP